jgi:hypothetical protein
LEGYPVEITETSAASDYPAVEDHTRTTTATPDTTLRTTTALPEATDEAGKDQDQQNISRTPSPPHWTHLVIGLGAGVILLFGLSILLAKIYFG